MLRASPLRRRIFVLPWTGSTNVRRIRTSNSKAGEKGAAAEFARDRSELARDGPRRASGRTSVKSAQDRASRPVSWKRQANGGDEGIRKPSLVEQLFPEETRRYEEEQRKAAREVPRLPLETIEPLSERRPSDAELGPARTKAAQHLYERMKQEHANTVHQTTVLVLRNASPHLVEEDFRRLVPQGKHLEGWTLEQGDILKVIPARDLATLEHQGSYYLLFSSALSAFTYQGHATRVARMAAAHTPSSMASPMLPPPGYLIEGMDASAAIESFALIPASQNLELRQLQPPLSPLMESIVRHQGYAALTRRTDKMPYEVRLTFDGPDLPTSSIRRALLATGKDRALPWSGGDEILPRISKWEPWTRTRMSPQDREGQEARHLRAINERTEEEQAVKDAERLRRRSEEADKQQLPRRAPQSVYILGFHTEHAAQTFLRYWHRRTMEVKGGRSGRDEFEDDLPPVANVEMLW